MTELDYVKKVMRISYKHPKFPYESTVQSAFELEYVLRPNQDTSYCLWLKQFFPRSYTAEIPPHIMEMAINQIKANQLIREVL